MIKTAHYLCFTKPIKLIFIWFLLPLVVFSCSDPASKNEKYDKEVELHKLENSRISQGNNERWKAGDTLTIVLPVEIDDYGRRSTFYYSYGYPVSLDYSSADDSLKIKGVLLQKWYESIPDLEPTVLDSSNLIFKLRILELSDENTKILMNSYEVGEEFDLHLKKYARPIK